MPILRQAENVSIYAPAEEDGGAPHVLDLLEHLSWHGIAAEYLDTDNKRANIGEALLECAKSAHATMIVMGAYSHSRLREAVLGGVMMH
jgi:nucleotide-binding universal stress UspA family protein